MVLAATTLHSSEAVLTKKQNSQKAQRRRPLESCFIFAKNAWPQLTNHNHTECQFRSFSTLTKAPDLDPMKQKKADVMGLRKSPRGVKPHPHTHHYPPPLPALSVQNPTLSFTLRTPLKRSPPLVTAQIWSP